MITVTDITGSAQVGLTSPTYPVSADQPPPGTRGKQYAISSLGGTQTGVEANTIGNPFTFTYLGPLAPKGAPATSNVSNQPLSALRNTHKVVVRKGVEVVTGYRQVLNAIVTIDIPAGAEIKDPESIRAALSCLIGGLTQISSGLGDTCINGTL